MTTLPGPGEAARTRIVLIRHADHVTDGQSEGDPELTELGLWQAHRLAERLLATGEGRTCSRLCTSTLLRARQTAEIVRRGLGMGLVQLEMDQALVELPWLPADISRLERRSAKASRPIPNGESWNEFEHRAQSALRTYGRAPGTTVIVCHTGIIEASFLEYAGLRRRSQRFAMAPRNASVTTWVRLDRTTGQRWRLETYNDSQHLWVDGHLRHRAEDFAGKEPFWEVLEPD